MKVSGVNVPCQHRERGLRTDGVFLAHWPSTFAEVYRCGTIVHGGGIP